LFGEGTLAFDFTIADTAPPDASFYDKVIGGQSDLSGGAATTTYKPPTLAFKSAAFSDESIEGLVSTIQKLTTLYKPQNNQPVSFTKYIIINLQDFKTS
jgi:hypothetical protein